MAASKSSKIIAQGLRTGILNFGISDREAPLHCGKGNGMAPLRKFFIHTH